MFFKCLFLYSSNDELSFVCLLPKKLYEGDTNMFILDVNNQKEDGKLTLNIVDQDNDTVVHFTKEYELKKADGSVYHLDVSGVKINRPESKVITRSINHSALLQPTHRSAIFTVRSLFLVTAGSRVL